MADRYWVGGTGNWTTTTGNWSAAAAITFTASCSGTALTTVGSPALVVGMTVWSSTNVSLGTIVSGSVNSWVVSVGGTYASQTMTAATTGATVPTVSDDVFFNSTSSASSYTVTITSTANTRALSFANPLSGTLTITGSSTLNCRGDFTRPASVTSTLSGPVNFATTTTQTITANGTITSSNVVFSGSGVMTTSGTLGAGFNIQFTSTGGTINLGGAIVGSGGISLSSYAYTFNTNNFNINCSTFDFSSGGIGAAQTVNLGSSTITITSSGQSLGFTSTNGILNAGAATFISQATNFDINRYTLFNLTVPAGDVIFGNSNGGSISGTFTKSTALGSLRFDNSVTINTFVVSGSSVINRILVQGNPLTSAAKVVTLTNAASVSNLDFQNITFAGASITGTSLGNAGNVTGITTTAAKTVYWSLVAGGNWNATAWATSSGGTPALGNFPLPQDTAIIEDTGLNSGAAIVFNTNVLISSIDTSTRTLPATFTYTTNRGFVGSYNFSSAITFSAASAQNIFFEPAGTQTITCGSASVFTSNIAFRLAGYNGSILRLASNVTVNSSITYEHGTIDLSTYSLSTTSLAADSIINPNWDGRINGTGFIILPANTGTILSFNNTKTNPLQFSATVNVNITGTGSRTISNGFTSTSFPPNINFSAGSGSLSVTLVSGNLDFTGSTISLSGTVTCYGNLKLVSTTTAAITFTLGGKSNTTSTIEFAGKTPSAVTISALTTSVNAVMQLQSALSITNNLDVSRGYLDLNGFTLQTRLCTTFSNFTRGIYFGGGQINITGNNATVLSMSNGYSGFTYTGIPNFYLIYAASVGTRTINLAVTGANVSNTVNVYVTGGTDAVAAFGGTAYRTFDFTGYAGTLPVSGSSTTIYGSLIFSAGMSFTSNNPAAAFTFAGAGANTITSAGKSYLADFIFNNAAGSWTLQDTVTTGGTLFLTAGALNLNNTTFTARTFSGSSSSVRSIAFGTGNITLTGSGAQLWLSQTTTNMTVTGSAVVNINNNTATASSVNVGVWNQANALNFNFISGTYNLTFLSSTSNSVKNVDFTGFSGTLLATSTATIFGSLKISTGMTLTASANALTFGSTATGNQITTNGKTLDFPVNFNGIGGSWELQDNLTLAARQLSLAAGQLITNNFNISASSFSSINANTRSVVAGTTNWTITGSGASWAVSALGFTYSGTGTISMTSASAKTFQGNNLQTWPTLNNGGAGALTISGSNRFKNITNTVQPTTFTFTSGTTNLFDNFNISGTPGNLVTLGATSTSQAILQKTTGWSVGQNSVNNGNNTGLFFVGGSPNYLSISYIRGVVVGPSPSNFLVFF